MANTASQTITIRSKLSEIQRVEHLLRAFITKYQLPSSFIMDFTLSAEELLTNIISYGYEDTAEHLIQLQLQCNATTITLCIKDDGRAYNPLTRPLPDITAGVQERPIGGLGIYLVRQLMDQVEYFRSDEKNILTLTKKLPPKKGNETDGMH